MIDMIAMLTLLILMIVLFFITLFAYLILISENGNETTREKIIKGDK